MLEDEISLYACAADMFHAVDTTLSSNNIPYQNLVELSVDNTNADMAQHTSLRIKHTEQRSNLYVLFPETGSTNICSRPESFKSKLYSLLKKCILIYFFFILFILFYLLLLLFFFFL